MHKLGAVVCASIIKNKPFVFNERQALKLIHLNYDEKEKIARNYLLNYRVAFLSGMLVSFLGLVDFQIDEKTSEGKAEAFEMDIHRYKSYCASKLHTPFEETMILHLANLDVDGKELDLTMLAALYYQWEEYTKLYHFGKKYADAPPPPTSTSTSSSSNGGEDDPTYDDES